MSILEAFISGIVQGACEFLPVSSSGHLSLIHSAFGFDAGAGNVAFDVLLHLGTLAAVLIVYRRDVARLAHGLMSAAAKAIRGEFKWSAAEQNEKLALLVALATIPLAAAALIKDKVETLAAYPRFVGAVLVLNGVMLILGGLIRSRGKRCAELGAPAAIGIGLFQLIACVPGLSRSGSTITGGRVFGLETEEAVRFSFIMSIPAILGANVFGAADLIKERAAIEILTCAVGMLTAAVVGFAAIKLIGSIARKKNFNIFGIYCVAVGLIALLRG